MAGRAHANGVQSVQVTGSVTVDGKVRKAYRLETIPEEAELVQLIYRKFLETYSLTKVDAYLLEQGIKTKTGRDFTRFSIGNILRNPVYLVADEAAWEYFEKIRWRSMRTAPTLTEITA